jgi:hypothetical protein
MGSMPTVTVRIKLFAPFRKGRFAVEMRDYPGATTVAEIARGLRIPPGEIGVLPVDGRYVALDFCPVAGNPLAIFPVIGGG